MLPLPKVDKGIRGAISRLEKVNKVVVGVALAMGVLLTGVSATDSEATPGQTFSAQTTSTQQQAIGDTGSLLLTSPLQVQQMAYHASHSSHSSHGSHASHASHASHTSSRY